MASFSAGETVGWVSFPEEVKNVNRDTACLSNFMLGREFCYCLFTRFDGAHFRLGKVRSQLNPPTDRDEELIHYSVEGTL